MTSITCYRYETSSFRRPDESGRSDHLVGVDDKLRCSAFIEIFITARGFIQRNCLDVDCLRDLNLVVKDRLHQLAVVFDDGALARRERVRLRPAQTDADPED